jgi:hypothetical protein
VCLLAHPSLDFGQDMDALGSFHLTVYVGGRLAFFSDGVPVYELAPRSPYFGYANLAPKSRARQIGMIAVTIDAV